MSKIAVLGLGGFGAKNNERLLATPDSRIDMCFALFDTSNSDTSGVAHKLPPENVYLLNQKVNNAGIDGSGQKPAQNYNLIIERKNEIMQAVPKADSYIVVAGGGGGSGSAYLRVIVPELIKRKERFVVVLVGDDSTAQFTQNTSRTLKSLHNLALEHGHITICYDTNHSDVPKSEVDKNVLGIISSLCVLLSGVASGLDGADVYAFLNPDKQFGRPVTGVTHLSFASRSTDELLTFSWQKPIALATIVSEGKEVSVGDLVVRNCYTGIVPATQENDDITGMLPVIAMNSIGLVPETITALDKKLTEMDEKLNAAAHLNVSAFNADDLI